MNDFSVAIAIDFGTTFSGYAYAFSAHTSEGDIYKNTDWTKLVGQRNPYVKTPTQLLYNGDKFETWGYKSKPRLASLREENSANTYHFFEKFKTKIFHITKKDKDGSSYKVDGTGNPLQVDENGQPYIEENGIKFLIVDLISDYLREIRLVALQDVKNHTGSSEFDETKIRWCLTIPAIWDDAAKQLMEQAAQKAGILKDGDWDAGRFMFALEPEAAAVYCLYVADKELGIIEDRSTMMLVDCGGGTVDLTVHEIIREGREKGLREIVPGSGAADGHGAKDVDKNFLNYLSRILGGSLIDKFESQYPEAYLHMMDDWETFKYGFDPSDYERGSFRIPVELHGLLQKHSPNVLDELAKNQNGNNFSLWVTKQTMAEEIFGPVVDKIIERIEDVFKRIGGKCDYLYLAGGFATSRFLQHCIREAFSKKVKKKIIIPGEPGKSIMMGAASFARNPEVIRARRARLSYGVAVSTISPEVYALASEFLSNELPSEIKESLAEIGNSVGKNPLLSLAKQKQDEFGEDELIDMLKAHIDLNTERDSLELNGRFDSFIKVGDSLLKNHEVSRIFSVDSAYQQEADILIFASQKEDILFVDEPGVELIGHLNLRMPSTTGGLNRGIEVKMQFGDTKIMIYAKDHTEGSDSEVKAEIDFLTTYAMN